MNRVTPVRPKIVREGCTTGTEWVITLEPGGTYTFRLLDWTARHVTYAGGGHRSIDEAEFAADHRIHVGAYRELFRQLNREERA